MLTCAAYAFSGAGLIRKIPLLNLALPTISFICLVRGLYFSPVFFLQSSWRLAFGGKFRVVCGRHLFLLGTFSQLGAKEKTL